MKKRKLLTLVAFALLGLSNAWAQKDVTSQYITNATLSDGLNGWTNVNFNTPVKGNNTKGYASECYAGWGSLEKTSYSLTQTITLPAGHYTLVNYSFFRYGLNYNTDPTTSLAYLKAGDEEIAIKTLGSIIANGYANSQAEGANAFDSKMYRNTLDFTIDTDNTEIEIGLYGTFDLRQSWIIAGMFELIDNDTEATMDAPFDVTGYLTNPGFEYRDMSGWTLSESGALETQNNDQGFKVGGYYAQAWQSSASGALTERSMSQTISNLPAGYYKLTANLGGDGTYMDLNGKTVNWTADADYTIGYVLSEGEDLTVTAGKTAEGSANWIHFDNFKLYFCGDVAKALTTLVGMLSSYEEKLPAAAYSTLATNVNAYNKSYSDVDELLAAIEAVQALYDEADELVEAIAAYNTALAAAKAVDQTQTMAPSILTALQNAISTYETVDETSQSDLEAATAALNAATAAANTSIASYAIIANRTVPTNSTDGWSDTGTGSEFRVNTWSVEGNSDGSSMTTPFVQTWIYRDNKLKVGTASYTLEGLEPGEVYYAQALVRAYNEGSSDAPNGPNFFINDVETDMTQAGTTFTYNGMSGIYATLGGAATVGSDGKITLGVKIASDANYNWVAFKNVSIQSMDDALKAAVAEAKALEEKVPASVYAKVNEVVEANDQKWSTATDYETAIGNITNAVVAGTKFVEPYANFNAVKEQAQALLDESSSSEGRDELEDAYNTQIAAVENVSDWTDDDVEIIATATNALYAAIQLFLHPDYLTMEGTYYVEHVETSTYMAAGHDWGTRGIVNNTGLDLTLTANADRTVNFDTQVSNGGNNHFLGANLYMDSAAKGWIIEMAADDTYTISTIGDEGTQYIGVDENDNLVLTSEPTEWRFIDAATRIEELEAASSDYGMDATFLLKDPNFNRNDKRVDAWTVSEDCNNETLTLSGGNDLNNCAGSLNSTFDIYQTVSGAPAGVYELTAQGFYRQDGEDTEAIPYFYANGEKAELSAQEGSESDMSGASASFTKGLYTIEPIKFHVGEDGVLTVGIKNETAVNQWIVFDNFQLTYYGSLITLDEKEDNTAALDELDGQTVNVTLTRTLQTGGYNSFAVPFDISAETLADMGITAVKELESSSYDKENGTLTLNFETATSIEAGKPYLVKVSSNVVNPTFYGVTISNTAESIVTDNVDFIPTLGSTTFSGSDNEKNFLYIGEGNKLYNPASLSNGMKGFRAYFYVKNIGTESAKVRAFNLDFGDGETTGIIELRSEEAGANGEGFYDLMGRSIQGQPTQKGVYIKNGKKVIVK